MLRRILNTGTMPVTCASRANLLLHECVGVSQAAKYVEDRRFGWKYYVDFNSLFQRKSLFKKNYKWHLSNAFYSAANSSACRLNAIRIPSECDAHTLYHVLSSPATYATVAESNRVGLLRVECTFKRQTLALDDENLVKAILFEKQNGFVNATGKHKRFGDFLYEHLSLHCEKGDDTSSLEAGSSFHNLVNSSRRYEDMDSQERYNLLNQVAQALGFHNLKDLRDHERACREASQDLGIKSKHGSVIVDSFGNGKQVEGKELQSSKSTLSWKGIHPAIVFGSSEPINLNHRCAQYESHKNSGSTSIKAVESEVVFHNSELINRKSQEDHGNSNSPGCKEVAAAITNSSSERGSNVKSSKAQTGKLKSPKSVSRTKVELSQSDISSIISVSRSPLLDSCWGLDMPVNSIKALTAYQQACLEEQGFYTLRLLLQHYPRMYRNFQLAGQIVEDGQQLSFVGTIVSSRGYRKRPSLGMTEVVVRSTVSSHSSDGLMKENEEAGDQVGRTIFLHLKRFYSGSRFGNPRLLDFLASKYPISGQASVCGKVKVMDQADHFEIREYSLDIWNKDDEELAGNNFQPDVPVAVKPFPVYPSKGGLQPKTIEYCIQSVLPLLPGVPDPLPEDLRKKFELCELHKAYLGIHSPQDINEAEVARRRLVFDEFLYLQLGMLLRRQEVVHKFMGATGAMRPEEERTGGILDMKDWSLLTQKLLKSLPYSLTVSQLKATSEIMWDLQRLVPMSRLLQGDVGCGKTIVAFLALLEIVHAGYQGALMAPTEFLAAQHFQRITSWLEKLDEVERPRVALLTSSTAVSKARAIRKGLETGEINLAIGTHSLLVDSVKFSSLGLAVIDEQHRFGVAQRGRLESKGHDAASHFDEEIGEDNLVKSAIPGVPHVLAMSATPIPRTLALAMHGDMAISQITELPPGRPTTATYAFHGNKKGRQEAFKRVRSELESGGRVFVVYPVITESEELPDLRSAESEFKNLTEEFKDYKCGIVHGRMRPHEKEEAMRKFKAGENQILVSTTVIEVGIDIAEASMMVIEHAERYGMAQLHQLRGRVGRGMRDSSCLLLASTAGSLERLKLLETCRDGFYLAEVDLQLRGPGEMLGKRQSGYLPEFHVARLEKDGTIMEQARLAAEELIRLDGDLQCVPRIKHEISMRRPPSTLA